MKQILLKGGSIVNHDGCTRADILIEGSTIKEIGLELSITNETHTIDVTDRYILPGGVDLDCHLGEPSLEDPVADSFETGSKAAILGGTTTIVNTVNVPRDANLCDSFDHFVQASNGRMFCDYAACMQVSHLTDETTATMERLVKEKGMCLFTMHLGAGKKQNGILCDSLNEEELSQVLRKCRELGALPILPAMTSTQLINLVSSELLHECPELGPEINQLTHPERAEADTIRTAALHAFESEAVCPLLVSRIHSDLALRCFCEQRRLCRGLLFGQTTASAIVGPLSAQHKSGDQQEELNFETSKDWTTAAGYVNEPPLRPDTQLSERLIVHLNSGDIVSVGSGHRAIRLDVKASLGLKQSNNIPKGIAAVGCRLVALWDCAVENNGGMDHCSFVRAVSTDPARLANLYPRKGRIAIGSDADIVVWSKPDSLDGECWTNLLPNGVFNVFSGLTPRSRPEIVILRGHLIVSNGKLVDDEAHGQLLSAKPFGQMTFSRVTAVDHSRLVEFEAISREPYTGPMVGKDANETREETKEHHYFRKEYYDNMPKVALPPGQRQIHTSVKTAQPPGGSSNAFWSNN